MGLALPIACATLVIWLYLLLARGGFWLANACDEADMPLPTAWPGIAVIIPARNEAEVLSATLPTLLNTDYPGALHVVLVDDRSEDGTASVAARIAEQATADDRLTVITARPLPAGWKGKVWAMQCGLEHLITANRLPRYVLFTDADIAYEQGALSRLVARAEANGLALASLMVRLRCQSLAERLLIPAFVYFFRMLYPFAWVNQPERKLAAAAGGCMLARADALRKAGGLQPIRGALIDDCALGCLMKRQGAIWLGLTQRVHSVRAYPRFADIRAMVARSAYDQLGYSPLNLFFALLGMGLTYIAPVALLLFSSGMAQICGALAWACMTFSFLPILRFYGRSALLALALPLIAIAYMAFTLDSAWQYLHGRGGVWKGRVQATGVQTA